MLIASLATADALLQAHAAAVGTDLGAYRNHVYRVVNLCHAQRPLDSKQLEVVAVAAVFHDLGIWTDATFDYLPPSVRLARAWAERSGRAAWADELSELILWHHKLSAYRRDGGELTERFRRADWIDLSAGAIRFGVPRQRLRAIFAAWPSRGFRRRLAQLALARVREAPWSPLPMVRL